MARSGVKCGSSAPVFLMGLLNCHHKMNPDKFCCFMNRIECCVPSANVYPVRDDSPGQHKFLFIAAFSRPRAGCQPVKSSNDNLLIFYWQEIDKRPGFWPDNHGKTQGNQIRIIYAGRPWRLFRGFLMPVRSPVAILLFLCALIPERGIKSPSSRDWRISSSSRCFFCSSIISMRMSS